MRIISILCLLLFVTFYPVICYGDIGELQAKLIAETTTKETFTHNKSLPLRVHRREDLEDNVFSFQRKIIGKIAKAVYIFEVTNVGHFVISPEDSIYVGSSDGQQKWLVAISINSGQPYKLFGFKNAEEEFNKLIESADIVISTSERVQLYTYLYFNLVVDLDSTTLLFSNRDLKHKSEDIFFTYNPEKKAQKLYRDWWSRFIKAKLLIEDVQMSNYTNSDIGIYTVNFFSLDSSIERIPQITSWTLHFTQKGTILNKETKIVFR